MKVEILTSVSNGIFKRNRNLVLEAIKSFNGKDVIISLSKPRNKRTSPQNRYYWGVLVVLTQRAVFDTWGEVWSIDKTHEYLKENFCFYEKVNEETGQILRIPKSTTENSTTEQEIYHLEIRKHLLEWFDVDAPEPNQEITLKL